MKIYITENIENIIDGYAMVPIIYGKVDLTKFPDNSISEIIAIDAVDSIPFELLDIFLNLVVSKMRMGSNLILGGAELGLISRNIINGKLNTKEFNDIVYNKKSISSSKDLIQVLIKHKLTIDNVNIRGNNYEISASRSANKNQL